MKMFSCFAILLCLITILPLSAAAQTDPELKDEIATIKTGLAALTTEMKNLKESVDTRLDEMNKHVDARLKGIEKNFDRQTKIIIALIGIPLVIIAIGVIIWGILSYREIVKDRIHLQKIETLKQDQLQEIETLKQELKEEFKQEIERLTNQQIVSS